MMLYLRQDPDLGHKEASSLVFPICFWHVGDGWKGKLGTRILIVG